MARGLVLQTCDPRSAVPRSTSGWGASFWRALLKASSLDQLAKHYAMPEEIN